LYLPRSDSHLAAHPGRVPYPADRVTVWGEAHGPARIRSKLAAVYSSDRLDSGERLPLRISHWEGGYWSTPGDFRLPAIHSLWLSGSVFLRFKTKIPNFAPGRKFTGQRLVLLKIIYPTLNFLWMPWHLI